MAIVDERNRLDGKQKFQLTKWVQDNLERFTKEQTTVDQATEQAIAALGFKITRRNMMGVAGQSKEAILEHAWPSGPGFGSEGGTNHMPRRLAVVAQVLSKVVQFIETSGGPAGDTSLDILGDIRPLWNELLVESQVPTGEPEKSEPAPTGEGDAA